MISIEEDIDIFYRETEDSVNTIIDGSDEHLDLILSITQPLNLLGAKFETLNEKLYSSLANLREEDLRHLMPKLLDLNKTCMTLLGAIRTSLLYRDVRIAVKPFSKCHDFLREMIHDLKHFRLNQDSNFTDILNELNTL